MLLWDFGQRQLAAQIAHEQRSSWVLGGVGGMSIELAHAYVLGWTPRKVIACKGENRWSRSSGGGIA